MLDVLSEPKPYQIPRHRLYGFKKFKAFFCHSNKNKTRAPKLPLINRWRRADAPLVERWPCSRRLFKHWFDTVLRLKRRLRRLALVVWQGDRESPLASAEMFRLANALLVFLVLSFSTCSFLCIHYVLLFLFSYFFFFYIFFFLKVLFSYFYVCSVYIYIYIYIIYVCYVFLLYIVFFWPLLCSFSFYYYLFLCFCLSFYFFFIIFVFKHNITLWSFYNFLWVSYNKNTTTKTNKHILGEQKRRSVFRAKGKRIDWSPHGKLG